ncbi:hypothetical protein chiPu_0023025 [Chiloscyllium punctatum]|uniref:Uncharacterized protein n=1 Tax=Chiloscyllium punctatum TaxID=137246 RepID=A0A401T998_CHIPU|nr:hypothetical protein [Chiloscyllium punctatum]
MGRGVRERWCERGVIDRAREGAREGAREEVKRRGEKVGPEREQGRGALEEIKRACEQEREGVSETPESERGGENVVESRAGIGAGEF